MYIDPLVTNILKIKVNKGNTGHKTYRRHIPFAVNSVQRLNIKT